MLTGSSKAGRHKSRRIVESNLEKQIIPKVAQFVAPKNPYFVVAFANHMQYTLVSFLVLYFAVYMHCCSNICWVGLSTAPLRADFSRLSLAPVSAPQRKAVPEIACPSTGAGDWL